MLIAAVVGIASRNSTNVASGCAVISDSASDFATDVVELLADEGRRSELGAKGLLVISRHFAPDRAYGGIAAAAGLITGAGIEFHASQV